MQACTDMLGKLQTCYTCMLIVKLVITANNSYLVFPIYILCYHLCYHLFVHSNYSPHCTSQKSYVCHILVRAVCALQCLKIGLWNGDKGCTVYGQICD